MNNSPRNKPVPPRSYLDHRGDETPPPGVRSVPLYRWGLKLFSASDMRYWLDGKKASRPIRDSLWWWLALGWLMGAVLLVVSLWVVAVGVTQANQSIKNIGKRVVMNTPLKTLSPEISSAYKKIEKKLLPKK